MTGPDVILHDEQPPEYDESSIENDLDYAAAAGGLTDDPDMADADEVDADPDNESDADDELIERTRVWLDNNPEAVCS